MLTTEMPSRFDGLEKMSVKEILEGINSEDQTVPLAVAKAMAQIEALVTAIVKRMKKGGRLFYIGAGTSGRLGILDASECPPTFGVPEDWVIGIMAGGDGAIRKAVEFAEDNRQKGLDDLQAYAIDKLDTVIGIAASGTTPYVIGGVEGARKLGLLTGCITCNLNTPLGMAAQYPVEVVAGPEFVTGSTRMKAGTAQKLVLNMISTAIMIQLGRVKGNKMVDMKLSNNKLIARGVNIVMKELNVDHKTAKQLISKNKNVRKAIENRKQR
ncbi:N-acetylmuramic acid 6-phosphate etherase [Agriterribacter sp.]|uniref:N-acetylmuramic acid 6-phosphate etherase n=1 Tax=Agriterribacter sp. TaxID=2821509 RepID=UPI002CE84A37|nr:N-acetylmuramic acid 6-phosphate etherase [Agriterribacter sp.]HRO44604.1 N-acetylmuramic acid 6-phosphate etherase [Agriterribacter sp.]HRQ16041.1 N-acetylmuramic acid 6-phosphate etherase [Agriterribacter sp.]